MAPRTVCSPLISKHASIKIWKCKLIHARHLFFFFTSQIDSLDLPIRFGVREVWSLLPTHTNGRGHQHGTRGGSWHRGISILTVVSHFCFRNWASRRCIIFNTFSFVCAKRQKNNINI